MFLFDFVGFLGVILIIIGILFGVISVDNIVIIGGVDCFVIIVSFIQLVCILGVGIGIYDVEVNVVGVGLVSGSYIFIYNIQIISIVFISGSLVGLLIELVLKFYRGYYIKIDIRFNFNKNFIKRVIYLFIIVIDEINISYLLIGGIVCYLYSIGV